MTTISTATAGTRLRGLIVLTMLTLGVLALPAVELKPGMNDKLPAGSYTWSCYLPKAYAEKPEARFPVVYLSSPGGNPGNWDLEKWAERNGVIIIGINESKNGPWEIIREAQAAVLPASEAALRLHPALRYAMGTSGGGAASIELIRSSPERFAGVLVNVHSAGPPAKHVACVYIGGETDTTHPIGAVRATAAAAKSQGNPVRFVADPGDHNSACHYGERAEPYLDWLLLSTCIQHPNLTPTELAEGSARIKAELDAIATVSDAAKRLTRCETLLDIPPIALDKRLGPVLRKTWIDTAMSSVGGGDPMATHAILMRVSEHPQFGSVDKKDGKALLAALADLRKEEPMKSEWAALQAYRMVEQAEKKAGNTKGALGEVVKSYVAIARKYPTTSAGKDADASAKRVAGRLDAKH